MDIEYKNEINALLSFYGELLAKKQLAYLRYYYEDDFSIIEIAEEEHVSRQAVSDNLKKGCEVLEHYEAVLSLYHDSLKRQALEEDLLAYVGNHYEKDSHLKALLDQMVNQEIN
ncbi:DNA-binding protein [Fructobacillus fructosus]|uniref:DNA-binding protein n=1 Tax=Fructobacillus fructosus TaxID=1631 RepID=UPI00200ABE82|nr:DNA-binding protein [Fructobacillus fructosus]MCK8638719.1 DNA-binding protein [Fructobacillus fructosus]